MKTLTLTVEETAKMLGIAPQGLRVGLQRGVYPFGQAIPSATGHGYRYIISRIKFFEYLGVKDEKEITDN